MNSYPYIAYVCQALGDGEHHSYITVIKSSEHEKEFQSCYIEHMDLTRVDVGKLKMTVSDFIYYINHKKED